MPNSHSPDFPEDAVHGIERSLRITMPAHITSEDPDRALELIEETVDNHILVVDGAEVTDETSYGEVAVDVVVDEFDEEHLSDDYRKSLADSRQHRWWAFEDALEALNDRHESPVVVVFHNFDSIPESEHAFLAQKLKAYLESTDAQFFVTGTEIGIVSAANPDLRGRLRSITL